MTKSFNADEMYQPGFGPDGGIESSLNRLYLGENVDVEQDLLEGEIAPEESITGDHVFRIPEKHDE